MAAKSKKTSTKRRASTSKPKRAAEADLSLETKLRAILDKPGSTSKCLAFFEPLTETERRDLAPFCIRWFKKIKQDLWVGLGPNTVGVNPLLHPAKVAVFSTVTFTELKKLGHWAQPSDEHTLAILSTRKPAWTAKYVDHLLASSHYWIHWKLVRELVRRKLCRKPDTPHYYTGMIGGLVRRSAGRATCTLDELRNDPALLKDEVWRCSNTKAMEKTR